jgi:hypothetical protein
LIGYRRARGKNPCHDLRVLNSGTPEEVIETVPSKTAHPITGRVQVSHKIQRETSLWRRRRDISERRRAEDALAQAQREAMTHRISQAIRLR